MTEETIVKPTKDRDRGVWVSPDGKDLLSVTQILKSVGLLSYRGGSEEAMDRGTEAHEAIEAIVTGKDPVITDRARPYVESFVKWLEKIGKIEIVETERRYWNDELGLCGQGDLVARLNDGEPGIIDYKTGSAAPWHELQTAGYVILKYGTHPQVPRHSLYLKKDGKIAKLKRHETDADFETFLAAVRLAWWKKSKGVKGWLAEK